MQMADYEESDPFLPRVEKETGTNDEKKPSAAKNGGAPPHATMPVGWTAEGVPVVDPMMQRSQWESSIFSCVGNSNEFYSSDLEVCLLGTLVPCVLHGSNVERLGSVPGSFATHCLPYAGLYLIGTSCFGWNCLAPWFSYPNRTAMRRKFNIEGGCEALARSFGCCCVSFMRDDVQREQCETACDLATHIFCHACALCQEAREVRRRLPPPGFTSQPPVFVMIPPGGQAMGREGA